MNKMLNDFIKEIQKIFKNSKGGCGCLLFLFIIVGVFIYFVIAKDWSGVIEFIESPVAATPLWVFIVIIGFILVFFKK